MIAFSLMLAGILNLAGSISRDRETGVLTKLKSMPIRPWQDFLGRIMAVGLLSLVAAVFLVVVGIAIGARFSGNITNYVEAFGFLLLAIISAASIGLIIGTYAKLVLAAFFTGLGIALGTAFVSGIFISYDILPSYFRGFAHIYPISSATSSSIYLLLGKNAAGYNPLTAGQIISTILISVGLLAAGSLSIQNKGGKENRGLL
jgi:ABC-2 type transport system permease protein